MTNLLKPNTNEYNNEYKRNKHRNDFLIRKNGSIVRRPDSRNANARRGQILSDIFDEKTYFAGLKRSSQEKDDSKRKKISISEGLADHALSRLGKPDSDEDLDKIFKQKSHKSTNAEVVWTSVRNPIDWPISKADGIVEFDDPAEEFNHIVKQLEDNDFPSSQDKKEAIKRATELLPFVSADYSNSITSSPGKHMTDADLAMLDQPNRRDIRNRFADGSDPGYVPTVRNSTGHIRVHREK